jgi:hypothetical protein
MRTKIAPRMRTRREMRRELRLISTRLFLNVAFR